MPFSFSEHNQQSQKALEHVGSDIANLRTGRANVQMLDSVSVEAYGTYMKLVEVASVSAPDPTLLVVKPWDKSVLGAIEKAIMASDLNLNPIIDGDAIRIAIAPLTEEKRKEMVKRLQQKIESGRVMLRSIRSETKKEIEAQKELGGVSEDDIERDLQELEKNIQGHMSTLEEMENKKEKELLTL